MKKKMLNHHMTWNDEDEEEEEEEEEEEGETENFEDLKDDLEGKGIFLRNQL